MQSSYPHYYVPRAGTDPLAGVYIWLALLIQLLMKLLVKALLALFLLSTRKTLPGAYVIRFYYRAFVNLALTRSKYVALKKRNTFGYTGESKLDIFKPSTFTTYVSPLEIDMFVHKSNSTYFTDLDLARMDLVLKVFQKYFFQEFDNDFGHFKTKSVNNFPYAPIAMTECTFKKELKIFQKFEIKSKVVAWDEKWLFVMSEFTIPKSNRVHAVAMTKYVFKRGGGRVTINPEEMIERSGMLNDEVKAINKENYELVKHLTSTDNLEAMFDKLESRSSKL